MWMFAAPILFTQVSRERERNGRKRKRERIMGGRKKVQV
jgi:hypothetical protein